MIRFYLLLIPFASLIQSACSEDKPLIFNPYTLEIYDIGDTSSTYKDEPYVAACPATKYEYEEDFNEKFSLTRKSLFVRYFSKKNDGLMRRTKCKNSIEVAAAYYKDPISKIKYLKYGYEIYFIVSWYPDLKNDASYSHYKRVFPEKKPFFRLSLGSTKVPLLTEDDNSAGRELGFIWISKVTLELKKSKWRSNLLYSIDRKVDRPATKCNDYKLPLDRWFNKKHLDYYYSPKHQEKIFKSVKLLEGDCKSNHNCVEKYSSVPAYQLQTSALEPASCTNFTTVPIWSKTAAPVLDSLDKFLFAVAQVIDDTRKLNLFTDVFDTLTLPTADEKISDKQMYLYPEKKTLKIPKYILKMVTYQTHPCNITETLCWYLVVIVIHNQPKVTDKLCLEDKCKRLGWGSIQNVDKANPNKKSEHIYCCEIDEKLKEILRLPKTFFYKSLDLTQFPRYDKDTYGYKYDENKVDLIKSKIKHFFGDETSPEEGQSSSLVSS